jgi:uncharacterized integral membrane protein
MTSPGQPPLGPNEPQGGGQPTSTFPTGQPNAGGYGQPGATAGHQPGAVQPGGPGPSGYDDQGGAGRGGRAKQGPGWFTYLLTLLAAIIAIGVAVFIAQNTDRTTIDFFGTHKSLSVAAALGIALAAGFLSGLFLGLIPALKAKRQLRQLRRAQR